MNKRIANVARTAAILGCLPLSGCLSGAVSLAGNVVEGAVNITGDIAEGAVDRVTTSDEEQMKKDWKKSKKNKD